MTVLSVFTHEQEPTGDSKPGSISALRHARPDHETWRVDASSRAATDDLPPVLLQLPDLAEVETETVVRPASVADQVFWVALVLGALLALTLIWTGKKPPAVPTDVAPVWQEETNTGQFGSSESAPRRPNLIRSGIGLPRPSDLDAPETSKDSASPSLDSGDQNSSQMPSESELAAPPIQTARSADSAWDGGTPVMNPGEAAPVGTIITTPVAP